MESDMEQAFNRIREKYGYLGYESDEEMEIDFLAITVELYPDLTNLLTVPQIEKALETLAQRRLQAIARRERPTIQ